MRCRSPAFRSARCPAQGRALPTTVVCSTSRNKARDEASFHDHRQDWRTYRAKLVALERMGIFGNGQPYGNKKIPFFSNKWAHQLAQPEAGCLLLAKRDHADAFHRTVIYVALHDDRAGTVGYVLNKPSPLLLDDLSLASSPEVAAAFRDQPLFLGGPVNPEVISILHPDLLADDDDHASSKHASLGNLTGAAQQVAAGATDPHEYRLLAGHAGWAPYQLAYEVAMGSWYVVAASPQLVLPQHGQDLRHGDEMWRQILDLAELGPSWQPCDQEADV